jgi:16S rRNA (adenine1518-N6/adenine1519-N6)-dimethyltransferase
MAAIAQQYLWSPDRVTFLCEDVLDGRAVHPRVERALRELEPFVWVSNLPYSIAATLIVAVVESGLTWERATLLVQKEVADRLLARPGERAYGPLGVLVSFWARARAGRAVAAGAFWPPPRVRSCLVHLEPEVALGSREEYRGYAAWVRELFGRRRKQLGRLLRDTLGADRAARALERGGMDAAARPEVLPPASFLFLAREFPLKSFDNPFSTPLE